LAGIGKSALVSAAYSQLPEHVAVRRHYLDCDRNDSVEQILETLAEGLQVDVVRGDRDLATRTVVERLKTDDRKLLVFDNVETILDRHEWEMRHLLEELAPLPKVSVVVGLRAGELPIDFQDWDSIEVRRLDRQAAAQLFKSWSGELSADEAAVEDFVDRELEGVPLAIELLGRSTEGQPTNLSELRERLQRVLLKLPLNVGRDRHRSLVASLRISIDMLRDDNQRRLLALLGALPVGIAREDLISLGKALPSMGEISSHARRLGNLGFGFFSDDDRLQTLKPIRDYVERAFWPSGSDLAAASAHYLGLVPEDGSDHDRNARTAAESANVASMAAALPDRIDQCGVLVRQGDAELRAGQFAVAMNTFRGAAEIARAARDPELLAKAALGISGGRGGSGHSFDRADEERLEVLRDAKLLLNSDDPALKLEVVIRLMAELHFDASFQAMKEREDLDREADELLPLVNDSKVSLQLAFRRLRGAAPTDSLDDRLKAARDVMKSATEQADINTEIEAGHLLVSFLMEKGEFDQAVEERRRLFAERIPDVPDAGKRERFRWQDTVLSRAELLYRGSFDEALRELGPEPDDDDVTNSPYRRWLHQRVLLALDHDGKDLVSAVEHLSAQLKEGECRKFQFASDHELARLAYEWWPTWRSTHALVLSARGAPGDSDSAHRIIEGLSRREQSSSESALFGRILKHEYYVQVLALIALALQRLTVLAAKESDEDRQRWEQARRTWARELDRLLTPFDDRAVVPGSAVMNLGSVQTFRAMLKACAGDWVSLTEGDLFAKAAQRNIDLGSPPAAVRTLVAQAEMELLRGTGQGRAHATAAARSGRDLAHQHGMQPWENRATDVLGAVAAA
jgi:hypothetical protein